jgi:hypothetical protein
VSKNDLEIQAKENAIRVAGKKPINYPAGRALAALTSLPYGQAIDIWRGVPAPARDRRGAEGVRRRGRPQAEKRFAERRGTTSRKASETRLEEGGRILRLRGQPLADPSS